MIRLFKPFKYVRSFRSIDVDNLIEHKKKLVICDIDNTLVAHDEALPSQEAKDFIKRVQDAGLQICLISNNNKDRVKLFADALEVPYYGFAKKPLRVTYKQILKDYNMKPSDIVAVGDQLLTDVFGGNRMSIDTILTHPLVTRDLKTTKLNRRLENQIYRRLEKKNVMKRGVFDE